MMWFDKHNPDCLFVDKRTVPEMHLCDGRAFSVEPDLIADFTDLPFCDDTFYLAVFDPPHLKDIGENAYMAIKYGRLPGGWQDVIRGGFAECMRVLKPHGTLIFKWNETQISAKEIIETIGQEPLFGHKSGKSMKTNWLVFMKGEHDGDRDTRPDARD